MNETEKQKLIGELKGFYKELKSYKRFLDPKRELSENQKRYRESLREELLRKSGALKGVIFEMTGKPPRKEGIDYIWHEALGTVFESKTQQNALPWCIDATNEAIGKLETTPLPKLELRKEAPEASVVDNGEEQPFNKAWEIEIQGEDIKRLYPIITSVAAELRFKDCFFEARLASLKETDSYAPFDVFIIQPPASKIPVGFFALHALGNNRVVLRVPPRSRWHHEGALTPMELTVMGLSKSEYDEHFGQFIESLEERLTHYDLKLTSRKRLWRGFKEIIGIWDKIKP